MRTLFIADILTAEWGKVICRTFLHSTWQGMIAAALAGLVILCTRRSKSVVRYNLLCGVFASFFFGSAFTFWQLAIVAGQASSAPGLAVIQHLSLSTANAVKETAPSSWNMFNEYLIQPFIYYADRYASYIVVCWSLIFLFQIARMLSGLGQMYRLRREQVYPVSRIWKERVITLVRLMHITKMVDLKESARVKEPVVTGVLKPLILVPLGMFANLSAGQVEAILVHELAHVRRRDFAVNFLQRLAESIFFFNPFIAWISTRIREEREACCDDVVMEYTPDHRAYVEALISFRQAPAVHLHAMTLTGSNSLLDRVRRMIHHENKKLNAMEKITLTFVVLAITAFSFIPVKNSRVKKEQTDSSNFIEVKTAAEQPLADKKSSVTISPKSEKQKDTLPVARQIQLLNIDESFKDSEKETGVTALGPDGRKYFYKKIKNDIIEFRIDDVPVNENDRIQYNSVIRLMEKAVEDTRREPVENLNIPLLELKRQQEQLTLKKLALEDQQLHSEKLMELKLAGKGQEINFSRTNEQEQLTLKKLALEDQQLHSEKLMAETTTNLERNMLKLLAEQDKLKLAGKGEEINFSRTNEKEQLAWLLRKDSLYKAPAEIAGISTELFNAGVINDLRNYSFYLDANELTVNGKRQSSELHERLSKLYILHARDHFKYSVRDNSRSTDIYRE